jgi:hypothetical protein
MYSLLIGILEGSGTLKSCGILEEVGQWRIALDDNQFFPPFLCFLVATG